MASDLGADPQARAKLYEMIDDVRIAMFTTVDADGSLRSRPMANMKAARNSDTLWFFTAADSAKVQQAEREHAVNVAYADPSTQTYVSVSGQATLNRDRAKMKELWSPMVEVWFPKGLDDPNLALLEVRVEDAEYWDSPSSTFVQVYGFVRAKLTGKPPTELGDNEKLSIRPH